MRLTDKEIDAARFCVKTALEEGADQARIFLTKSISDCITVLNGETDNITHSEDRLMSVTLFVDKRYGTCCTNSMDEADLKALIRRCIATTRFLEQDPFRHLPDPSVCCNDAVEGRELGIFDEAYYNLSAEDKLALVHSPSSRPLPRDAAGVVSVENTYGDSLDDCFLIDSNGTQARHTETCFFFSSQVTVEGKDGRKHMDWWSETSPFLDKVRDLFASCPERALARALGKVGPARTKSGTGRVLVENRVASKLISPVIDALNTYSTDQKQSFLCDCLGRKVFSDKMTLTDLPRVKGRPGAGMFDDEGLATANRSIIGNGVIMSYFTDGYMAAKTGSPLTISEISSPELQPTSSASLEDMVSAMDKGILVTGFLGGNSNPATGDFSYGIEGYVVRNGKRVHPFSDALITGNLIELWNKLEAVGADPRPGSAWQIPSLLFSSVRVNA